MVTSQTCADSAEWQTKLRIIGEALAAHEGKRGSVTLSYFLLWLLPPSPMRRPGGGDVPQPDAFPFLHNRCWFYTRLAFYGLPSPTGAATTTAPPPMLQRTTEAAPAARREPSLSPSGVKTHYGQLWVFSNM